MSVQRGQYVSLLAPMSSKKPICLYMNKGSYPICIPQLGFKGKHFVQQDPIIKLKEYAA